VLACIGLDNKLYKMHGTYIKIINILFIMMNKFKLHDMIGHYLKKANYLV